jgi:hypothetical protein
MQGKPILRTAINTGVIAGLVDVGAASLINAASPTVILRAISSGLLGLAAYSGAAGVVILGLALQGFTSVVIAGIFCFGKSAALMAHRSTNCRRKSVRCWGAYRHELHRRADVGVWTEADAPDVGVAPTERTRNDPLRSHRGDCRPVDTRSPAHRRTPLIMTVMPTLCSRLRRVPGAKQWQARSHKRPVPTAARAPGAGKSLCLLEST